MLQQARMLPTKKKNWWALSLMASPTGQSKPDLQLDNTDIRYAHILCSFIPVNRDCTCILKITLSICFMWMACWNINFVYALSVVQCTWCKRCVYQLKTRFLRARLLQNFKLIWCCNLFCRGGEKIKITATSKELLFYPEFVEVTISASKLKENHCETCHTFHQSIHHQ